MRDEDANSKMCPGTGRKILPGRVPDPSLITGITGFTFTGISDFIITGIDDQIAPSLERDTLLVVKAATCHVLGVGAGCSCRYATKYQVTYEIVGYLPTTPCVERVVRRYAWCRQRSYRYQREIVGTLLLHTLLAVPVGTARTYQCYRLVS